MKHLKKSMMLLLTVAIFTSCEKETFEVTEVSTKETVAAREELQPSNLQFFFDEEDFPCTGYLPTEDFSEANFDYSPVASPLNEYSSNSMFSPGEIQHGVSFETQSGKGNGFYLNTDYEYHFKNLMVNNNYSDLHINFSVPVFNVKMNVYNWQWNNYTDIEVYGNSGLLGNSSVYPGIMGTFVGITSLESITSIVLKNYNPGVDNITFGNCADYDNDGVLNEEDPYPNSNMSESLSIGENNLDIENVFAEEGTTMMDQIDALVAEINAQYNGNNWDALHRDFTRGISKITYQWRKDRLISRGERSDISSAAWSANIPYIDFD